MKLVRWIVVGRMSPNLVSKYHNCTAPTIFVILFHSKWFYATQVCLVAIASFHWKKIKINVYFEAANHGEVGKVLQTLKLFQLPSYKTILDIKMQPKLWKNMRYLSTLKCHSIRDNFCRSLVNEEVLGVKNYRKKLFWVRTWPGVEL